MGNEANCDVTIKQSVYACKMWPSDKYPHVVKIVDNGKAEVTLIGDVRQFIDGYGYEYDEYIFTTDYRYDLDECLLVRRNIWLSWVKDSEYRAAANKVLKRASKLIELSYTYRGGSLGALLSHLSDQNPQTAEIIEYRKKLRAIPDQPGFPYNVVFPEKPKIKE